MSWIKEAQPPRVMILSYAGDLLSVLIGGEKYSYYANPRICKTIDFYTKKGWHGKALAILNKLERM